MGSAQICSAAPSTARIPLAAFIFAHSSAEISQQWHPGMLQGGDFAPQFPSEPSLVLQQSSRTPEHTATGLRTSSNKGRALAQSQTRLNCSNLRFCDKSFPGFITDPATSTSRKQHNQPSVWQTHPRMSRPKAKARAEMLLRLLKTHPMLLLITKQPYRAKRCLNKEEINLISSK